jgi:ribosomal protein S27AE
VAFHLEVLVMAHELCPKCGEPLDLDEVDVGVGTIVYVRGCSTCGWTPEMAEVQEAPEVSPSTE